MDYPFSQPNIIYQISFYIEYKNLELYEDFFMEDSLGVTSQEVDSETVESMPTDLWKMQILLDQKPDVKNLKQQLNVYSKEHGLEFIGFSVKSIEDRDWVAEYQKQLKPLVIGDFFITSSLLDNKCPQDKTPIYIEASRAFGTGDHATTSLCIEAISEFADEEMQTIFDIGAGSGILSFVAEKILPNSKILACDIDAVSVEIAQKNIEYNKSSVEFYKNTPEELLVPVKWESKFDLIVSNILAGPLIFLAPEIRKLSNENSIVILSGFLDYQLQDVQQAYHLQGFKTIKTLQKDQWVCLVLAAS